METNAKQRIWYVVTHTCVERCVGKQEGGRVEADIEQARLVMVSNPCALRRLLMTNLKRL